MQPWTTLDSIDTDEGKLVLRRRGDSHFTITIGGRVLMTSGGSQSEEALAVAACKGLKNKSNAQVLIGGLGMAYTLRAALDELAADSKVTVAELTPQVVTWCKTHLASLTNNALKDDRTTVKIANVAMLIANAKNQYDAIILDLYEGPHHSSRDPGNEFYGSKALERTVRALKPGGRFAVWAEERDKPFEQRLARAGLHFTVELYGSGGRRRHPVYIATYPTTR